MSVAEEHQKGDLSDRDDDFAEGDYDDKTDEGKDLDQGKYESDFSLFKLTFSEDSVRLDKGVLEGQQIKYTEAITSSLPFKLTAMVWKSKEQLDELYESLKANLSGAVPQGARLAIEFPSQWGIVRTVEVPLSVSADVRDSHIRWSLQTVGWEDEEAPRYNYLHQGDGVYILAAVRESLVVFAQTIAEKLSAKLVQLSLSGQPDLNLIIREEGGSTEPISSEFAGERKFRAPIVIPLIFVLVAALGYYLIGVKKLHLRLTGGTEEAVVAMKEQPTEDVVEPMVEKPVDEAAAEGDVSVEKPVKVTPEIAKSSAEPEGEAMADIQLFSSLYMALHKRVNIYHLSFTGSEVRGKITTSSRRKIDTVIKSLDDSGLVKGTRSMNIVREGGMYSAVIVSHFLDRYIDQYSHPQSSMVKSIIASAGYKVSGDNIKYDNFTGSSEEISSILQLIDRKRILIYRIRISQISPDNYVLTLEY